jgi:hypothetical protein
MNKNKKDLIIIENSHNDKGSKYYLNQIRKQWRESFQDSINLIVYTIDSQAVLEEVLLLNSTAKVLLLTPTELCIPSHMEHRNAEQNQTAKWVVEQIRSDNDGYQETTEILLIGKGRINQYIFNELCIKDGYCVTMYGSKFKPYKIASHWGKDFDIIVNAISQDSETKLKVDWSEVYDCSGNFVRLEGYDNNITTMKEIGIATTLMLLNDVKKG